MAEGRSASLPSALARGARAVPVELVAVVAITGLAAFIRLYRLDSIPFGLHGDEAWTGLDGDRVLREGWIGPYVGSALGQPTGPLYWAAIIIKLFGDGVFSVRLSMALLGIATIPLTYLAARMMFDRRVALLASLLLALSAWHLQFSRLGFMVISWPLVEVAALALAWWSLREGGWWRWLLTGAVAGVGVYTYNAYFLFALALGAILLTVAIEKRGRGLARYLGYLALAGAAAAIVALPLLLYIRDPHHDYFAHNRLISVFHDPRYEQQDTAGKITYLRHKTVSYIKGVTWSPRPDGGDGAGSRSMLDRMTLVLLVGGVLMSAWRWRSPSHRLLLAALVVLPVGAVITVNGMFRRSLGIVPITALLAALPLAWLWGRAEMWTGGRRLAGLAAVAIPVLLVGVINVRYYFGSYPEAPIVRVTFAQELTLASEWMAKLPANTKVLFYSGRWGYDYETRRYLAPDVPGEDRSLEFGKGSRTAGTLNPDPAWQGGIAYVFLAPYLDRVGELEAHYPGGLLGAGTTTAGEPGFVGYYLSPQALAAGQPFAGDSASR